MSLFLLIYFLVSSNVSIFFCLVNHLPEKLLSFLIAKCIKSKSHAMNSGFYSINLYNHLPLFPKQCLQLSHIHEVRTSFLKSSLINQGHALTTHLLRHAYSYLLPTVSFLVPVVKLLQLRALGLHLHYCRPHRPH